MRPARPWSWALLVLLLVALTAAATATAGDPSVAPHGPASHGPVLDDAHPAAADAVAVLAERLPTSGPDRSAPTTAAGLFLLGLALAVLTWPRGAPAVIVRRVAVRPPGGAGRRAPPLSAS